LRCDRLKLVSSISTRPSGGSSCLQEGDDPRHRRISHSGAHDGLDRSTCRGSPTISRARGNWRRAPPRCRDRKPARSWASSTKTWGNTRLSRSMTAARRSCHCTGSRAWKVCPKNTLPIGSKKCLPICSSGPRPPRCPCCCGSEFPTAPGPSSMPVRGKSKQARPGRAFTPWVDQEAEPSRDHDVGRHMAPRGRRTSGGFPPRWTPCRS